MKLITNFSSLTKKRDSKIDDFGTGYSSLSYLQNLPFRSLKIAMPFVQDIGTHKKSFNLISSIFSMAKDLSLETIAEGIETESQLEKLKELGCRFGQGYLFATPLKQSLIEDILSGFLNFDHGYLAKPKDSEASELHV